MTNQETGESIPEVIPERFLLKYTPPTLVIQYHLQNNPESFVHHIRLVLQNNPNAEDIVNELYNEEFLYFKNAPRNQVTKLINQILNKVNPQPLNQPQEIRQKDKFNNQNILPSDEFPFGFQNQASDQNNILEQFEHGHSQNMHSQHKEPISKPNEPVKNERSLHERGNAIISTENEPRIDNQSKSQDIEDSEEKKKRKAAGQGVPMNSPRQQQSNSPPSGSKSSGKSLRERKGLPIHEGPVEDIIEFENEDEIKKKDEDEKTPEIFNKKKEKPSNLDDAMLGFDEEDLQFFTSSPEKGFPNKDNMNFSPIESEQQSNPKEQIFVQNFEESDLLDQHTSPNQLEEGEEEVLIPEVMQQPQKIEDQSIDYDAIEKDMDEEEQFDEIDDEEDDMPRLQRVVVEESGEEFLMDAKGNIFDMNGNYRGTAQPNENDEMISQEDDDPEEFVENDDDEEIDYNDELRKQMEAEYGQSYD